MSQTACIRTPDHRLRVFISSTLTELVDERQAAQEAITDLRLTPILFELGARPHPPRELYQAYLQQSDIFIGVYWERYGWIAPGMQISGLEDEYHLSRDHPRLVYIKEPASNRDPQLEQLIDLIRSDGNVSYQKFSTPEELYERIQNDLAILISERFVQSVGVGTGGLQDGVAVTMKRTPIMRPPPQRVRLIGRAGILNQLSGLLTQDDIRVLTLTGPGGVGKTRVSESLAAEVADAFVDGVCYVVLDAITDSALVMPTIAGNLGLPDAGGSSLYENVRVTLGDRHLLLVLDNFEQVIDAAGEISWLCDVCPHVKIIVTSRMPLRIPGEQEFPVAPLQLPERNLDGTMLQANEAVQLFIQRVSRFQPNRSFNRSEIETIAEICRRVEGLPLAIELAAARIRLLSPNLLLSRLDRLLPVLSDGDRALPERQRTMRAAIQWSYQLLSTPAQLLFRRLAVFHGDWDVEAAEDVGSGGGVSADDVLGLLSELVEQSLLETAYDENGTRYRFLVPIAQFARELLEQSDDADSISQRHAMFYLRFVARAEYALRGAEQTAWLDMLEQDRENVRAAVEWALDGGDLVTAVSILRGLTVFWVMRGGHVEGRAWAQRILESSIEIPAPLLADVYYVLAHCAYGLGNNDELIDVTDVGAAIYRSLSDKNGEDILSAMGGFGYLKLGDVDRAEVVLTRAATKLREADNHWARALILGHLALTFLRRRDFDRAIDLVHEALDLTRASGDRLGRYTSLFILALASLELGRLDDAHRYFAEALELTSALRDQSASAYCLQGLMLVAAKQGDFERAAQLHGASDAFLRTIIPPSWAFLPDSEAYESTITAVKTKLGLRTYSSQYELGRANADQGRIQSSLVRID